MPKTDTFLSFPLSLSFIPSDGEKYLKYSSFNKLTYILSLLWSSTSDTILWLQYTTGDSQKCLEQYPKRVNYEL